MGTDSRLGLKDTMPFGKKHKGKTIEEIYKVDAGFLLWLRDARALGGEYNGKSQPANKDFFDDEVLCLLNETLRQDADSISPQFKKFAIWTDVKMTLEVESTGSTGIQSKDFYNEWGAF